MGKSRKNAGKTTGKCWEYAGDLLVRKPMVKPNRFFMIKPFETWQTNITVTCGSLELVTWSTSCGCPEGALRFRKSDYSGKNA